MNKLDLKDLFKCFILQSIQTTSTKTNSEIKNLFEVKEIKISFELLFDTVSEFAYEIGRDSEKFNPKKFSKWLTDSIKIQTEEITK